MHFAPPAPLEASAARPPAASARRHRRNVHFRVVRRRCQDSSVPGVTSRAFLSALGLVDDGEAGRFGEHPRGGVEVRQPGGQGRGR